MIQPDLFAAPAAPTWTPPAGKSACRRDLLAGPGSCYHWWDSCPKAKQRGCYLLWLKERASTR